MSFDLESYITEAKRLNHSDDFINSTIEYATALSKNKLPVIFSSTHLELLMGIPKDMLMEIIKDNTLHYNHFSVKKRNNFEYREIQAPSEILKYIQRWIKQKILHDIPLPNTCVAYRTGYSIKNNADIHADADLILKIDLLKFFDTITEKRVFGFFKQLGYNPGLAVDLAKLTTVKHDNLYWDIISFNKVFHKLYKERPAVLPQGAPTSPIIANHIAKSLDDKFEEMAKEMGFRYSRYADDLTFSIKGEALLPSLSLIKKTIKAEGFYINFDKVGYYKRGMKQYVTGLTVTHGVHVSKKTRREIYSHLHFAKKFGPVNHMEQWSKDRKSPNYYNFQDWLLGKISFVYAIDKKEGIRMFGEYKKIKWEF